MIVAGIDPGVSGAVALYDTTARTLIHVCDMPAYVVNKTKRRVEPYALANILAPLPVRLVVIEQVASRPKQGVASSFNFGVSFGIAIGVCAGLGLRIERVIPGVWKSALRIPVGSDKAYSLAHASQMFGNDKWWPNKGHHGRAEAALLARYGADFLLREGGDSVVRS
jgi:hypothetical protein